MEADDDTSRVDKNFHNFIMQAGNLVHPAITKSQGNSVEIYGNGGT